MNNLFYEVILLIGNKPLVSWKFNSVSSVVRYLAEVDFEMCTAECLRSDGKIFDVDSLMEAWFNA